MLALMHNKYLKYVCLGVHHMGIWEEGSDDVHSWVSSLPWAREAQFLPWLLTPLPADTCVLTELVHILQVLISDLALDRT